MYNTEGDKSTQVLEEETETVAKNEMSAITSVWVPDSAKQDSIGLLEEEKDDTSVSKPDTERSNVIDKMPVNQ